MGKRQTQGTGPVSRVFAVILNWNGGSDTVDCLESLSNRDERDLRLVVVDNGSQDDSIARIEAWAREHATTIIYTRSEAEDGGREADEVRLRRESPDLGLVIVKADENLGFAAGSNVGIRYALRVGAELVLLLNNDTVIAPEAVGRLVAFLNAHPDFAAVTGQIRYHSRSTIWNCGGELTWFGSRRYLFGEQPVASTPQTGWRRISFMTGCAALIRSSVLADVGLLTDRFFFGEEDYEFSMRLRRMGHPIACCFDAVISHKVGTSIDKVASTKGLGRYYIYYLNRFIDLRDYYPRPLWWLWRYASLSLVLPRLHASKGLGWRPLMLLGRRLLRDSKELDRVSRERFEVATSVGLESL